AAQRERRRQRQARRETRERDTERRTHHAPARRDSRSAASSAKPRPRSAWVTKRGGVGRLARCAVTFATPTLSGKYVKAGASLPLPPRNNQPSRSTPQPRAAAACRAPVALS